MERFSDKWTVFYNERYNVIRIGTTIPDGMNFAGMVAILSLDRSNTYITGFMAYSRDGLAQDHWIELGEL